MKAATFRQYGPPEVLRIKEIERPLPKDNEVLVKVHASSVTSGDARIRGFTDAGIFWLPMRLMFGIFKPRHPVPGMEFAGEVAAVGNKVRGFQKGDPVFGMTLRGANAEYLAIAETGAIAAMPSKLGYEEAAAIPFGATSALEFLRDIARVQPGERILIHGASGSVGVFAVQLAKHLKCHVTAVCSTPNIDLVKSIGADKVIDYKVTDFTEGAEKFDVVLDTVGVTSFSRCRRVLAPNGRHVFVSFQLTQLLQMLWTALRRGKRVICGFSSGTRKDLAAVRDLVETGIIKPVIDRVYGLEEIAEAHRYVATGRKKGSVVIAVANSREGSTSRDMTHRSEAPEAA